VATRDIIDANLSEDNWRKMLLSPSPSLLAAASILGSDSEPASVQVVHETVRPTRRHRHLGDGTWSSTG
jgi:hypothetical protein